MKKILIGATVVLISFILLYQAYFSWGFYLNLNPDAEITTFAKAEGKSILLDTGDGMKPFEIKGVNIGAGIPGHFATEYAIDQATYLRWFHMIKDMGANTIRVYTILSDDFYNALYKYNLNNPDPLYLLHGVWVDDYVQNSHLDAYDDSYMKALVRDSQTLVDVLHGRKRVSLGYGGAGATGSYSKDVSPWVLGYILGVEWEDVTVAYTDQTQKERNSYQGNYLYTTENASPFEAMLALVGDRIISYETNKYHTQKLVAFSNWPTTDPFDYPEVINRLFMKCAKVDTEHIKSTQQFLSGQFASYHVYSYYPDYLNFYDEWKKDRSFSDKHLLADGRHNTYRAYLELLNRHHSMPVVISEFGVPTSRGRAQMDINTARSQGYMSEHEQGLALVESYQDIMDSGCAGSAIFSWQDEWFKRTWNTMANVDLARTAYWSDFQTNEQFFGLLAFDPGREPGCYTDGDISEWSGNDILVENQGYSLSMKYDEKFIYFRVHRNEGSPMEETLYIPLDITPKSGSLYARNEQLRFENPADFLIIIDGTDNSRVLVQEHYDPFHLIFTEDFEGENPFFNPPAKDSPVFQSINLALQLSSLNTQQQEDMNAKRFETGILSYGNGNPLSPDYHSISDYISGESDIEIRIPWQLLNFSNPSDMNIHDDYYENYGIRNLKIDEIYAGIGSYSSKETRIPMNSFPLKGWGKHPAYTERLKQSYYVMQDLWTSDQQ